MGLRREISLHLADVNDLTEAGLRAVKVENEIKIQSELSEKDQTGCVICLDKSYIAKDCSLLTAKKPAEKSCKICNRVGHETLECRKLNCQICH